MKKIKVTKYNKYSLRVIMPKSFCKYLGIDENSILNVELDKKGKKITFRKEEE